MTRRPTPIVCALLAGTVAATTASLASAEPTSDSLSFTRLATVEHMGRIDVNPFSGEIAVGTTGPGFGAANRIRVVSPDGGVRAVGDAVPDPDAVAWDIDASIGLPGSILVGGIGGVYSVGAYDGFTAQVFEPSPGLVNPEDMALAANGELVFADYNTGRIQSVNGRGDFTTLARSARPVNQITLSGSGDMLFADQSGGALVPSSGGPMSFDALSIATPADAFLVGLAFGDGSALWGTDTYAVDRTTGDLLRFGESSTSIIATGLLAGFDPLDAGRAPDADIGFLPTGEMVIAIPSENTIWTVVPSPSTVALLGLGGLTAMVRRRK
ncbi:MAG: PEP-CTERM sorting domain-containing protein [Planctomycetota bacterium]